MGAFSVDIAKNSAEKIQKHTTRCWAVVVVMVVEGVGICVGSLVGCVVGVLEGTADGIYVGTLDGKSVGAELGTRVGICVG